MAIDYQHLKSRPFAELRKAYDANFTMLYALSLGVGQDPLDATALPFVFEACAGGLRTLPTQAVVLGYPGFWSREPDTGIDWVKLVHGEQRMVVHRPLPGTGTLIAHNRITHITDKGAGKGAIVVIERRLHDEAGVLHAVSQQVNFCRGDGGYSALQGGQPSDEPLPALQPTPDDRTPDRVHMQSIRPEAALLYRLLADPNPLHADPAVARAAGFERPILHGLASYGMACWAVVCECAGGDPSRLRSFDVRFAAPVFPGETLRTEMWLEGAQVRFQARVLERDKVVMSHGRATLS